MTRARLIALSMVVGCVQPSCRGRSTADELIAAIASKSVHVEKRAELEPRSEWVGGELGLDLMLDYEEPYLAVRFTAADLAHAYCQEGEGGIPWGVWCVEPAARPFRPQTWSKVNELRR